MRYIRGRIPVRSRPAPQRPSRALSRSSIFAPPAAARPMSAAAVSVARRWPIPHGVRLLDFSRLYAERYGVKASGRMTTHDGASTDAETRHCLPHRHRGPEKTDFAISRPIVVIVCMAWLLRIVGALTAPTSMAL